MKTRRFEVLYEDADLIVVDKPAGILTAFAGAARRSHAPGPPSLEELRERLERRGTDAPEVIEKRMHNAEGEMSRAGEYMFQVTNDDLAICYKRLCDLIDALSGRM